MTVYFYFISYFFTLAGWWPSELKSKDFGRLRSPPSLSCQDHSQEIHTFTIELIDSTNRKTWANQIHVMMEVHNQREFPHILKTFIDPEVQDPLPISLYRFAEEDLDVYVNIFAKNLGQRLKILNLAQLSLRYRYD